jgi:hypothetical protein
VQFPRFACKLAMRKTALTSRCNGVDLLALFVDSFLNLF